MKRILILTMPKAAAAKIATLRERAGHGTDVGLTLRSALALYAVAVDLKAGGGKLLAQSADGETREVKFT